MIEVETKVYYYEEPVVDGKLKRILREGVVIKVDEIGRKMCVLSEVMGKKKYISFGFDDLNKYFFVNRALLFLRTGNAV